MQSITFGCLTPEYAKVVAANRFAVAGLGNLTFPFLLQLLVAEPRLR